jgi:hypothetical protein
MGLHWADFASSVASSSATLTAELIRAAPGGTLCTRPDKNNTGDLMKRAPLDYAVSLLLVPVICIGNTFTVRQEIERQGARLGNPLDSAQSAQFHSGIDLMLNFSIVVLAASILLPVLFTLLVRGLGDDRNALAAAFVPLVRAYLVGVALVLIAQACLVLSSLVLMFFAGMVHGLYIPFILGAIGLGVLAAAFAVLADMRRMLERTPVQVTGALLDTHAWPALHKRIEGIASKVRVVPDQVVISLAPQTFATAGAVRLRGEGELDDGVTLCVSAPELRALDEEELDATIAAALGTLSNEEVGVSRKLIPSYRSLVACLTFFEQDGPENNRWFKYARIPANGFLAAMLSASRAAMRKVAAQRRSAAQGAALHPSSGKSWAPALAKATVLHARWAVFRSAYESYMLRGQTRSNLSADFVAHVATFAQRAGSADRDALATSRVPHPFDESPTLAEQMADQGIDTHLLIRDTLAALGELKAAESALPSIEARITKQENDYFHVPGRRMKSDDGESTPAELLTV